jgi:hypothetical protein
MAYPRRKFTLPTSLQVASATATSRVEIIEPTLGLNTSQPEIDLQPGESPDAENFIVDDGYLRPRSGLSLFADSYTSLGQAVPVLAYEYQSVDGSFTPVVASSATVLTYGVGAADSWSTLSYCVRYTGATADTLSGNSTLPMGACVVYEPNADENWLVFTNGHNIPKFSIPSTGTYSEVSDFASVESYAKYCYAIDDRLCFFHCADSATTFATRVRWSERGNPSKFSTVGAGYQDIMDMKGEGTGVAVREIDALLFSTDEIWVQRPRRDNFAYDFLALSRGLGTRYHRSIVNTPIGTVFMGNDFMHYLVSGSQIVPIGQKVHAYLRDNIADADYAFALYNKRYRRYEFYYRESTDADRPQHALYFDIDNASWTQQTFPFGLAAGIETAQSLLGRAWSWDDLPGTWNEMSSTWNRAITPGAKGEQRDVLILSSTGSSYRFRSAQGTDDGSTITCRWISHGLNATDATRKTSLDQIWAEYKADEAGAYILETRGVQSDTWGSASTVTYTQASSGDQRFTPLFVTGDRPQFRFTITDGKRPSIGRLTAGRRDAGQF